MKTRMWNRTAPLRGLSVVLGLLVTGSLAQAQDTPTDWRGVYAGGGGVYSNLSVEQPGSYCSDCYYFDVPSYDTGDGDYSWMGYVGYRVNRYFAVEATYLDAGTIGWSKAYVWIPDLAGYYHNDVEFTSTVPQLSVLGILPFLQQWECHARLGVGLWNANTEQTLTDVETGAVVHRRASDDGVGAVFGLGLGYTFGETWHVRLQYQATWMDGDVLNVNSDTTIDTLSLELQYRFGAHAGPTPQEPAAAEAAR